MNASRTGPQAPGRPMTIPVSEPTMLPEPEAPHEALHEVVIRFAGDSGDGMQVTGGQFTSTSALVGNDLSTLPDFPAEIRAPRSEEHTSELQSPCNLVCRLLIE